jgi:hypothetical protein
MSVLHTALLSVIFVACSCSTRYAKVQVVTNDPTKGSVSLRIFDAKSGLILGDGVTPTEFVLTKMSNEKNPVVSLLVVDRCYPMKWKLVEITKWAKNIADLSNSIYVNQVQVAVVHDNNCIWDIQ